MWGDCDVRNARIVKRDATGERWNNAIIFGEDRFEIFIEQIGFVFVRKEKWIKIIFQWWNRGVAASFIINELSIGAATARVARVRTLPTFEKVKLDPPNFLGWTRPGPTQYSIPNYLILLWG